MRRAMGSVDDLIEEAKARTVCWALCIFAISYFLTRKHAQFFLLHSLPSPDFCYYAAIDGRHPDAGFGLELGRHVVSWLRSEDYCCTRMYSGEILGSRCCSMQVLGS